MLDFEHLLLFIMLIIKRLAFNIKLLTNSFGTYKVDGAASIVFCVEAYRLIVSNLLKTTPQPGFKREMQLLHMG